MPHRRRPLHHPDSVVMGRLIKDIVNEAANQLAVVGVIGDPDVVLPRVHAALHVGLTETPSWSAVVLEKNKNALTL